MQNNSLLEWGFTAETETLLSEQDISGFEIGRIISAQKDRYLLVCAQGEYIAEVTGNMRFSAQSVEDLPVVGDWVAIMLFEEMAIIHQVLPRKSLLSRKQVGKKTGLQPIASNIDTAIIVMGMTDDFNLNRLERFLTIVNEAQINPVVLLSKMDLVDDNDREEKVEQVSGRAGCPVYAVDNLNEGGYEEMQKILHPGHAYCLIGSSGVGKTTLINKLTGREDRTRETSDATHKGKHTTTHRELIPLPNGSLFFDTPGMREIGIADASMGLATTFENITNLSADCQFSDCNHIDTPGCRVLEALDQGEIDEQAYENYLKMQREAAHYSSNAVEKRKKDRALGKLYKNTIEFKKKNR